VEIGRDSGYNCFAPILIVEKVLVMGKGSYPWMMGGVVITKNDLIITILIMIRVISFDDEETTYNERFDKFQQ